MRAFRMGRIFGIELRADWSWVFIFVLMTWNLLTVFSQWHPAWPPLEDGLVAVGATVMFFGCILLHELAHSVVAMRYGLRVQSITLFLFGGLSNIEHEPPAPGAEFLIAIVGPITSIALGLGFLFLASAVTTISWNNLADPWNALAGLGPLATLFAWLGPINIMIGLFNMVPGFPLDGGRVLRSIVWKATGSLRMATVWASAAGQSIGWLFLACGLAMALGVHIPFFGTGLIGGLWLAFIGWFLHSAAAKSATRLALDDVLAGVTVEQLVQRNGPTAETGLSVATLVHDHFVFRDDRSIPVVRNGVLLGIVSVVDIRGLPPSQWTGTPVESIMRRVEDLSPLSPQEPLAKAFERLAQQDVDQLPVVDNGRFVGMLRRRDVTRWLELVWKPSAAGTGKMAASGRPARSQGLLGRGRTLTVPNDRATYVPR